MEKNRNIGNWSAILKKEGKDLQIIVNGSFPTNGEKPVYRLTKSNIIGIIVNELILKLEYGTLADPKGSVFFNVFYSEEVSSVEDYNTVLVVDENSRTIANIKIEN